MPQATKVGANSKGKKRKKGKKWKIRSSKDRGQRRGTQMMLTETMFKTKKDKGHARIKGVILVLLRDSLVVPG